MMCNRHFLLYFSRRMLCRKSTFLFFIDSSICRAIHVSQISKCCESRLSKIRNIGILAHIDAGKTTTTERMLFYSGKIRHMGEVHHGNTVTDYMEQERTRGITIASASVMIPWNDHRINIIDTPGHIDFTMEVEQSLNVMDGAVIILDGSAGVEAQTVTVWNQADLYNIPRVVYVNKMDRSDSSFTMCLESLNKKFHLPTLPVQLPIRGNNRGISGIADVIHAKQYTWKGEEGCDVVESQFKEGDIARDVLEQTRCKLIDRLADLDDEFTEVVLNADESCDVSSSDIVQAIRRVCVARKGIPVFCGSSYKNIGVQKLLDGIIDYLPSPRMRADFELYKNFGNALSAKAFKVVHDKQKGPVTFFRIFTGEINKNQKIYNVTQDASEQCQRVMEAHADDYEEVAKIESGNIAAVSGLKLATSGDFIISSQNALKSAISALAKSKNISNEDARNLICPPKKFANPVFFCSIEPPSLASSAALETALEQLQREDPSLTVRQDLETGQTVLGGMGELHLEIIKDRILSDYKIKADVGPLQIAYKEFLISSATETHSVRMTVGNTKHNVKISLSIYPREKDTDEFLKLDKNPVNVANVSSIKIKQLSAIKSGLEAALQRGPKVGLLIDNACFTIHWLEVSRGTSETILISASAQCVKKLLDSCETVLMEPMMKLEVVAEQNIMTLVTSDLTRRRADILDYQFRGDNQVVIATAPLVELLGYSKALRTSTSGKAAFTMEFHSYREVNGQEEGNAIKNITGFYPM